jgi:hypothetical protein
MAEAVEKVGYQADHLRRTIEIAEGIFHPMKLRSASSQLKQI